MHINILYYMYTNYSLLYVDTCLRPSVESHIIILLDYIVFYILKFYKLKKFNHYLIDRPSNFFLVLANKKLP